MCVKLGVLENRQNIFTIGGPLSTLVPGGKDPAHLDVSYKWSDITLTLEDFYFKKGEVLEIVEVCGGYYSEVVNTSGVVFAIPSFYLKPSPRDSSLHICTGKYVCKTDEARYNASVEQGETLRVLQACSKDAIYIVRSISRDVQVCERV